MHIGVYWYWFLWTEATWPYNHYLYNGEPENKGQYKNLEAQNKGDQRCSPSLRMKAKKLPEEALVWINIY